jgi:hypothetical protein
LIVDRVKKSVPVNKIILPYNFNYATGKREEDEEAGAKMFGTKRFEAKRHW